MGFVSNDPSWWPVINAYHVSSYFAVVASVGVMYDWALMFGQEVEFIWRQRWSLMTVLYLIVRYAGIIYAVNGLLISIPTIAVKDMGCRILYDTMSCMDVVINLMLGAIMITRLYAMYQRSKTVLICIVVVLATVTIANVVITTITTRNTSAVELILSGTYECTIEYEGDATTLYMIAWILGTVWEVLALCLAAWIAVKHFRELRQHSAGGIIGDCFTVLMKTHVSYFASFLAVSCFDLGYFSPALSADLFSLKTQMYLGFAQIFQLAQMFVLGPRLILSVREYHAKLVVDSDAATGMTSIAFQERVHVSTSSSV